MKNGPISSELVGDSFWGPACGTLDPRLRVERVQTAVSGTCGGLIQLSRHARSEEGDSGPGGKATASPSGEATAALGDSRLASHPGQLSPRQPPADVPSLRSAGSAEPALLAECHLYDTARGEPWTPTSRRTPSRPLHERRSLTQRALAERPGVTDKAISKWETGRGGLPDVSLVEPLGRGSRGRADERGREEAGHPRPEAAQASLWRAELSLPRDGRAFLVAVNDTARGFNRHTSQLAAGGYPCRRLQELWDVYGADGFDLAVAMTLTYDDPTKDQSDALEKPLETCLETTPGAQPL